MRGMVPVIASSSWAPILQTAVGALIGADGAIAGGAFGSWFAWQKERQSVAAAFAGEVQGFIDVVDWLDWGRTFYGLIQIRKIPIEDSPFPVFEANAGKIGLLPADLAAKVAGFYTFARGILQELRAVNKTDGPSGPFGGLKESVTASIETMQMKGKALVPELQKEAQRTWIDCLQPT